nr:polysaccharide deacetylase family protein [Gammaproteobacteria bacterium]
MNWQSIRNELDRWHDTGMTAFFWWRDDDAIAYTKPLRRLLACAHEHRVAVGLAVIPAYVSEEMCSHLDGTPFVDVLQHGYAHKNWASVGAKKAEFPEDRDDALALADIRRGWQALEQNLRRPIVPIFVPPWNRFAAKHANALLRTGLRGISQFGPVANDQTGAALPTINTHLDIIDWRADRGFAGEERMLTLLLDALTSRRARGPGAASGWFPGNHHEPIGLLTHHLVHDDSCWLFIESLLALIHTH